MQLAVPYDCPVLLQASGMWEVSYHALHDPNWIVKQGKNSESPVVCDRLQPGTKYVFKARAGEHSTIKLMHIVCTAHYSLDFCTVKQGQNSESQCCVSACSQVPSMSSKHWQVRAWHITMLKTLRHASLACSVQK